MHAARRSKRSIERIAGFESVGRNHASEMRPAEAKVSGDCVAPRREEAPCNRSRNNRSPKNHLGCLFFGVFSLEIRKDPRVMQRSLGRALRTSGCLLLVYA